MDAKMSPDKLKIEAEEILRESHRVRLESRRMREESRLYRAWFRHSMEQIKRDLAQVIQGYVSSDPQA